MSMEIRSYTHCETTLGSSETGVKISTDNSNWPSIITFKPSVAYFWSLKEYAQSELDESISILTVTTSTSVKSRTTQQLLKTPTIKSNNWFYTWSCLSWFYLSMALRLYAPSLQSLHQPKVAGATAGGNSTGDRNGEAWSPAFLRASVTLPTTRSAI